MRAGRAFGATTPPRMSWRLRGSVRVEQTIAKLAAARLWELLHSDELVRTFGALTGAQAVQMVTRRSPGDLPLGVAGRRRRQPRRADVSRSEHLSGEQRPGARQAPEQRAHARRPDRLERGEDRPLVDGADRGRRGSGFRRTRARVRADEVDDRGRRGRRALRGSARGREEVRSHGRQGAGADVAVHSHARRSAPRGRRHGRADADRRAHGRAVGDAADVRRR